MYESGMDYECVFNEMESKLMNYELMLVNFEFNVLINNEFRIRNTMNLHNQWIIK